MPCSGAGLVSPSAPVTEGPATPCAWPIPLPTQPSRPGAALRGPLLGPAPWSPLTEGTSLWLLHASLGHPRRCWWELLHGLCSPIEKQVMELPPKCRGLLAGPHGRCSEAGSGGVPGACLPTRHRSSLKLLSFTHSSSSLYLESSAEITHPVFLLSADRSHCRPKTKSHLGWRLHRHHLGYSMQNACRNIYSSRSFNCIPFVKYLKLHSLLGFLRWVMISAGGQLLPA